VPDRTQAAGNQVAGDRVSHGLRHDETDPCRICRVRSRYVEESVRGADPSTPAHGRAKVVGSDNPVRPLEHEGTTQSWRDGCYADSSVRPLRRRAARIERPARVRIRRRNPWTFARRRLFGWNVLLLIAVSPFWSSYACKNNNAGKKWVARRPEVNWLKIRALTGLVKPMRPNDLLSTLFYFHLVSTPCGQLR
jgi:hypothetical protein